MSSGNPWLPQGVQKKKKSLCFTVFWSVGLPFSILHFHASSALLPLSPSQVLNSQV